MAAYLFRRIYFVLFVVLFIHESVSEDKPGLPTVTVRGFLNFKTTVDGTVIVFTPASQVPSPSTEPSSAAFLEKQVWNSEEGMQDLIYASPPPNSLETIKTHVSDLNIIDNKIKDPFLQHISENAVLPSTDQMNHDLDKMRKLQSSPNQYPTGLVTVLGGTFVDGPLTTVFETKVIGTYIDGKYAQILQSTSHIISPIPTPSLTVELKEASEQIVKPKIPISSTPVLVATESMQSTPAISSEDIFETTLKEPMKESSSRVIPTISLFREDDIVTCTKQTQEKSSTDLESSFTPTTFDTDLPTETLESVKKSSTLRKLSTPNLVSSTIVRLMDDASSKAHRNGTSRTRFLSRRRPSQTVRLNRFKVKLTLRQDEYNVSLPTDDEELEEEVTPKEEEDVDVVTNGIGLSVDPARVVFQETTITSEVTLHVGRRKSVRTLTITTSVPLTINPTDIQDILSSQSTVMDDQHIVTRTFTTTERALQTSVVPIFDGKSTMYHTVTESFFIMKIITAYRTLPLGDQSVIESFLHEPEIVLEAAANIQPSVIQTAPEEDPSLSITQTQVTNPLFTLGHALSNNPLAAVYLGLQQLNAQITLYSTVTDLSSYVTTETIFSTKTIRFYDGRSTRHRMISEPVSTKKKTITATITSVQPYLNTHAIQQQQQFQKLIAATPQYNTLTSTYTTVSTVTSLSKRIYTLIYNGFSTKFRTLTSSTLYPTTLILTTTTQIPFAATHVNLPFPYSQTN